MHRRKSSSFLSLGLNRKRRGRRRMSLPNVIKGSSSSRNSNNGSIKKYISEDNPKSNSAGKGNARRRDSWNRGDVHPLIGGSGGEREQGEREEASSTRKTAESDLSGQQLRRRQTRRNTVECDLGVLIVAGILSQVSVQARVVHIQRAFDVWKRKTFVWREYREWTKTKACAKAKMDKCKENIESASKHVDIEEGKKRRLSEEIVATKAHILRCQRKLTSMLQRAHQLKQNIDNESSAEDRLKTKFRIEQRRADTRRASMATPPHLPKRETRSRPALSQSSKSSHAFHQKLAKQIDWDCPVCADIGSASFVCRRYQLILRRYFAQFAVASSESDVLRMPKRRWIDFAKDIGIVPSLLPRRVAVDVFQLHGSEDAILGVSLRYVEFLRTLVSVAMIVHSAKENSAGHSGPVRDLSRVASKDEQLLSLFCQINRQKVQFSGAEEELEAYSFSRTKIVRDTQTTAASFAAAKTGAIAPPLYRAPPSSMKATLNREACAILVAARAADAFVSGLGRPLKKAMEKVVKFIPAPVKAMPEVIVAALFRAFEERCNDRPKDQFAGDTREITIREFVGLVRDAKYLRSALSLTKVRRVFEKYAKNDDVPSMHFGLFVMALVELSNVMYPAEPSSISLQRLAARILEIPVHIERNSTSPKMREDFVGRGRSATRVRKTTTYRVKMGIETRWRRRAAKRDNGNEKGKVTCAETRSSGGASRAPASAIGTYNSRIEGLPEVDPDCSPQELLSVIASMRSMLET